MSHNPKIEPKLKLQEPVRSKVYAVFQRGFFKAKNRKKNFSKNFFQKILIFFFPSDKWLWIGGYIVSNIEAPGWLITLLPAKVSSYKLSVYKSSLTVALTLGQFMPMTLKGSGRVGLFMIFFPRLEANFRSFLAGRETDFQTFEGQKLTLEHLVIIRSVLFIYRIDLWSIFVQKSDNFSAWKPRNLVFFVSMKNWFIEYHAPCLLGVFWFLQPSLKVLTPSDWNRFIMIVMMLVLSTQS